MTTKEGWSEADVYSNRMPIKVETDKVGGSEFWLLHYKFRILD